MRRPPKQFAILRWPPWVLITALLILPVLEVTCSDEAWTAHLPSTQPEATKQFEPSSRHLPASQQAPTNLTRRASGGALEKAREGSIVSGLVRQLLGLPTINPGIGSKLDLCAEFTKPDSLKIRLMGTPKNHRSPPA